jgi:hypothetical protein
MLPLGRLSLGKATEKTGHVIWAPSIPPINWTELHQTISVPGILIQASQLRNGTGCTFAFGTDEQPFSGSQCIVFVVEYADGISLSGMDSDSRTILENGRFMTCSGHTS